MKTKTITIVVPDDGWCDDVGVDPVVKAIVLHYKDEMKEKLRIALKPFMDKIKRPLTIVWTLGEKK